MNATVKARTVVINALGARMGGARTLLQELMLRFGGAAPGHQFIFYVDSETKGALTLPDDPNVFVKSLHPSSSVRRLWWDQWTLPRVAERYHDVVLLSLMNFGPRWPRCRQVVLQHNTMYFDRSKVAEDASQGLENALRRRIAIETCRGSRLVLTPSAAMQRDLIACLGADVPVEVLPHAVDLDYFNRSREHCRHLPARLLEAPGPRLVYVAHPAAHKGHSELIRAFRQLVGIHPGAVLALTFDTTRSEGHSDAPRSLRIMEEAADLPGIVFVGRQNRSGVRALCEWADFVVFPSRYESFGLPVLEAMAMGKALVCSNLSCLVELAGDAALYHAREDAHSIADAMLALAGNPSRAAELGAIGRRRATFHDWDRYMARLLGFLFDANENTRRAGIH